MSKTINVKPRLWARVSAVFVCAIVSAISSVASAIELDFAVAAERVHQTFGDGEADLDTLTFTPALQFKHGSLSLSAPWQHIEGSYFVNNIYPNLAYTCNQINALTPLQKLALIKNTSLTLQDLQYCNQTGGVESKTVLDSVEGFNDVELFGNYYLPLGTDSVSGSLGLGYKFDNGDVETGLGTGTRDVFVENAWYWQWNPVSVLLTLGYNHVLSNQNAYDLSDYGYGSLSGNWYLLEWVALGVECHYQQANSEYVNDFNYWEFSVELGGSEAWRVRLFATDYRGETGYPDTELGGSLSYRF